ncbi:carbohydrate ABC transporter permease [Glycomyces buryatensis]|uniref:Sugar ABC transporter permease n=1 Tax=Glycomyces buryatensis TaxID=2570927 RepID=A0A4S8PXV1_9ACTN|nr:sugar ABC transporter permease [Glycomyces buryatensis]THV36468.1 sugar ABC transporter permease [Glycomyces buryatensis]
MTATDTRPAARPAPPPARRTRARARRQWAPYLFISPFFILFTLFMLVPIGAGIYLSFTDWAGLGTPEFIGTANYTRLFQDESFGASLANTGFYTVCALIVVLPASLMIAQALNARGLKLRDFFRLVYFMPVVLSPIIIALIFGLIFDGEYGLFNAVLEALFGFGGVSWLTDPLWARIVVVVLVLWRWTGFLTIFFLAGLQNIPQELNEAALVDGAGPVRRFFSITIPILHPVTAFIAVTMLVNTAQIFEEPFLLTNGGPGESTLSISMFVYRAAFLRQELGYAAAAGVVMFVIVFALGRLSISAFGVGRNR